MDESTRNDTTTRSARRRWAVPAVVAGVVVAAVATPPLVAAAGDADLPEVTPEELVTSVLEADDVALQGTVVHTARLGLPELPITEIDGADPLALLGGSSTVRVWSDGADRSRLALLGRTSEFSVVRDGAEAWTYSSSDDEVVHYTLDESGQARYAEPEVPGDLPSPQDGADLLLGELREHSNVSVDAPTTVAGRAAYQLVVTPQDEGTLVDRAVLAVDAETRLPLRYQVWSTTAPDAPAIEVGFTDVTFRAPDPDVLDFSAPSGASVREVVVPTGHEVDAERDHGKRTGDDVADVPDGVDGSVHGEGWSRVVEVSGVDVAALVAEDPAAALERVDPEAFGRLGSDRAQELADEMGFEEKAEGFDLDTAALYEQLTTEVPEGRLLSSTLLSVLVTDDGRVLAGAVPPETLRDRV